ncbi:class I SAM-dependent methyltransferase [Cellulomonas sp. JZ18]|uniref:class I SAM-dependent methyltransferase n=1 Tax=Cellulomonas sp. JZ18 TaxID=2654191 RepID=UPI0018B00374|nr:class I SAM-dependent methyltransferase [Cellulomonas sp. JZ18]
MSRYSTTVDPAARNSSQVLALELTGADKDVLDVGCASGDLARALRERGCRVSGVELDAAAAEEARPHLERLVVGDVATLDLAAELDGATFDVLVLGDVLEHLADPAAVLRRCLPLLRQDGDVVISVPNVAHGALRLALLQGRWRYTETGLLDGTHLRFFTRESLLRLVSEAGLEVVELWGTVMDPLGSEVEVDEGVLPDGVVDWVRRQEDTAVYQYVVRARRGSGDVVPPLQLAVAPPVVPPAEDPERSLAAQRQAAWDAERAALVAEVRELRHTVMTLRDQVVGAQAQAGTAEARAHRAEVRGREALEHAEALLASRSYRLGQLVMRPVARVVRGGGQ